jgi:hypothetical protein
MRFEFVLQFSEPGDVITRVRLYLAQVLAARIRREPLKSIQLRRGPIEIKRCVVPVAFRAEQEPGRAKRAGTEDDQKGAQETIRAKPAHGSLTGLRKSR